jgi:HSP20 family molecular chaperone IbpA
VVASSPSEVQEVSGEVVVRIPILGFTALELYVLPDWDSLTIEGRIKQRRTFDGKHWTETIEKRLSHRLVFDFELDPNRVTATLNDATVEIVAHKLRP